MEEIWDIYDENKKKTGRTCTRDGELLKDGEYHLVVTAIIINSSNQILISKRAEHKKHPLMWECNGGAVRAGENSLEGVLREIREELGLEFSTKDAIFFKELKSEEKHNIKDLWLFRKDASLEEVTFPDGEAIEAKWVSIDEFEQMNQNGEMILKMDFGREAYETAITMKQNESYEYIGKEVHTKIDRPLGSKHPKHDYIYPVNYGYIPGTLSEDGEELDCYILGISEPVNEFLGTCIAVIHRIDDNDDKIIIVPNGKTYSDEEIREITNFQEKYFESVIIR